MHMHTATNVYLCNILSGQSEWEARRGQSNRRVHCACGTMQYICTDCSWNQWVITHRPRQLLFESHCLSPTHISAGFFRVRNRSCYFRILQHYWTTQYAYKPGNPWLSLCTLLSPSVVKGIHSCVSRIFAIMSMNVMSVVFQWRPFNCMEKPACAFLVVYIKIDSVTRDILP